MACLPKCSKDFTLRAVQLLLYVLTLIFGLVSSISLGWSSKVFGHNCLLYAEMNLLENMNGTLIVEHVEWGSESLCNFCTYAPVFATIYAIIWFWFYVLISDWSSSIRYREEEGSDSLPPDMRLILPTLFCNVVLFISCFTSAAMVDAGKGAWCDGIIKSFPAKFGYRYTCDFVKDRKWLNYHEGYLSYGFLKMAIHGSWLLVGTLAAKAAVAGLRLYFYLQDTSNASNTSHTSSDSDSEEEYMTILYENSTFINSSENGFSKPLEETTTFVNIEKGIPNAEGGQGQEDEEPTVGVITRKRGRSTNQERRPSFNLQSICEAETNT